MIINAVSNESNFAYYCNGVNDDAVLITFITNLRNRGFSNFNIDIIGNFKNSQPVAIDNTGYTQITLDFKKCNRITSVGSFLNVKNVRVKNCAVYHQNNANDIDVVTFTGENSVFENCRITGGIRSGSCYGFKLTDCKVINCDCELNNNGGLIYGIYGSGLTVQGCNISVLSVTASAYGIETTGSFVSDSRFKGETGSNATTASGNGGIGGGYYTNCLFVGLGGLKGQGFYIRAGAWLTAPSCVFRGYSKNIATGWGTGITGPNDSGITIMLLGINCNQIAVTGYSQSKAAELPGGYGMVAGTFFTAPAIAETIEATTYNRNRS